MPLLLHGGGAAERIPDLGVPETQEDVGRRVLSSDGGGRGGGGGGGGGDRRGRGRQQGEARLGLEAGDLPLGHVAGGGAGRRRSRRRRGELGGSALLAQLLLHVRVPVVLDLVVRPARQLCRDHGPPEITALQLARERARHAVCVCLALWLAGFRVLQMHVRYMNAHE